MPGQGLHASAMKTLIRPDSIRSTLDHWHLTGPSVVPGEPAWDTARQAWNLAVDQQPMAVVFPRTVADVTAVVEIARTTGARVVTQGTGHGASAYGSMSDTILVRTTQLQELAIGDGRARVGAGTLWGDVADAAGAAGLSGLGGSSPDVGVVGYTLGGGIGWLARRFGLASNAVRSIDLVTADGRLQHASHERLPELFWALRGGGGGLGVVVGLEMDLFPVTAVIGGTLVWDAQLAPLILPAWSEWTAGLDDSITSIIRFLNAPDVPGVPELFRGRHVMTLGLVGVGDPDAIARSIKVMRTIATPTLDSIGPMPAAELCRLHGDPEGPTAGMSHHTLLGSMEQGAIDALIDVAGADSTERLISVEVRHLGGALARTPDGAGALSHIGAPYLLHAVGAAHESERAAWSYDQLGLTIDAMRPWAAGEYLNFVECPTRSVFDDATTRRLAAVKSAVDPTNVFRLREGVPK